MLTIKDWSTIRGHRLTKDWVKYPSRLLDDQTYRSLPAESRALLPMLWVVAAERGGEDIGTIATLAFRLRMTEKDLAAAIQPLIEAGYVSGDIELTQPAKPVKRTTNSQAHAVKAEFEAFWAAYPRKVGKAAAMRAWEKHRPDLDKVLAAIAWQKDTEQWRRDGGQYIPHPSTWLNQGRWMDEPQQASDDLFAGAINA